ncbi:zinc metalloproteinase nas-13-like [Penaeus japonicus]|uniref:zinc metalloproteinase nas-13-like n=1 Tax=Penaeus japonicus TaxID=27405 RepID=UPI001C714702|nr:zinc metalloproteinase nas-13-like [Penaeus japonicus]
MEKWRLTTFCFLVSYGLGIEPPYFRHSSDQLGSSHAPLLSSHAPLLSSHTPFLSSYNGTRAYNSSLYDASLAASSRLENMQHTFNHNLTSGQHNTDRNIIQHMAERNMTQREQHAKEHDITHGRDHEAHNMAGIRHEERNSMMSHDYEETQALGGFDLRVVLTRVKAGQELLEREEEHEVIETDLTSQEWDDVISGRFFVTGSQDNISDPLQEHQLFEGDIVASSDQLIQEFTTTRNAITSLKGRWPEATVPYKISASLPHAARFAIVAAFLQFYGNTCINFVPRTSQRDYVLFRASDVCSSSVGRQGSRQVVRLSPRCYTPGIVVHELMHVLGFWHEQARADRDSFVTVIWDNVSKDKRHNFVRKRASSVQDFGAAYDYALIAMVQTTSPSNRGVHESMFQVAQAPPLPWLSSGTRGRSLCVQRPASSVQRPASSVQRLASSVQTNMLRVASVSQSQFPRKGIDVHKLNALYNCFASTSPPTASPTNACEDRDASCRLWSARGECQRNGAWMRVLCRRACSACDDPCLDDHIYCAFWADAGECTSNRNFMLRFCRRSCLSCLSAGSNPQCQDQSTHCQFWADSGQCVSNPRYMLEKCKKACKLC